MKRIRLLACLSIILLIALYGCEDKKKLNKLQEMEWLLGKWQMDTDNGKQYEEWVKENDTLFSGKSYLVFLNDTIILEYINLQLVNNELFYLPIVLTQNEGEPVSFKLIERKENKYIFENKLHDFPQRIIYKNFQKDSLHAWIEGVNAGKDVKIDFFMSRCK